MTFTLDNAVVYDIETLPNCWTLSMEALHSDMRSTWEISEYRDDRPQLRQWLNYLHDNQIPMIGFNSVGYDYIILHLIYTNPQASYAEIYAKNQAIFASQSSNRFEHIIWDRDRFAPQIDLFKVMHFDNRAKTTSLKALEINMRSSNVRESRVPFGVPIAQADIDDDLIPYNKWDVSETKKFAYHCMKAINFRIGLIPQFGIDVLNYNDSKIGSKILEQRLGDEVCYDRSSGRKRPRQTPRNRIALNDIIFPKVRFEHPEFQRVLDFMRAQTLTPDDITDLESTDIKTKGVFSNLTANVGGIEFYFGTGGIHGSVSAQRIIATDEWEIHDIDVEGLYPRCAVVNQLRPEHLGALFVHEYAQIPLERKKYKKGTVENAALKLAANGTYGNSNNKFSVFYDPKFTLTITVNCQLLLCMLAERLVNVPTLQIVQINTDGITYRIHRDYQPQALAIQAQWEQETQFVLERVQFKRVWIADVNTFVMETIDGKFKQKGRLWHPDPLNYADSISEASPPAWHKDLSNIASVRAAVAAMVHGIDPETWLRSHTDAFDFMCRTRATGQSELFLGGQPVQKTIRYYVAREGAPLTKLAHPAGPLGAYKRAPRVTKADYDRAMLASGGEWVEGVCTAAKTRYEMVTTNIESGWKVADCCDAANFSFANLNYEFYISEAKKLIIQ